MKYLLTLGLLFFTSCTRDNASYVAGMSCMPQSTTSCGQGTVCDPTTAICTCPSGSALCGQSCADLTADPANCGGCGLACPSGQTCSSGRCSGGGCPTGAIDCGGSCIDPLTNPQNCGGCGGMGAGRRCGNGQDCVMGVCTAPACGFGLSSCSGACVSLASDPSNCGACGKVCPSGSVCSAGQCGAMCGTGLTACGTACVDLKHDPANCGACGVACKPGEVCAGDGGTPKCVEFQFAGCNTCPCTSCGDRRCCNLPAAGGGYRTLCVDGACP